MLYTLMNRNIKVLDFYYNSEYNSFLAVANIYDLNSAPISMKNNSIIDKALYQWIKDRKIPPLRDGLNYLLDGLKLSNTTESMITDFGLSLSDQYWFLLSDQNVVWNDINYFDNNYNTIEFMKFTFEYDIKNDSDIFHTLNMSTNGQLGKYWIQKNKKIFYLKEITLFIDLKVFVRL